MTLATRVSLRHLAGAAALITAATACGQAAGQIADEGQRPIGILLAAGDIANCASSRSRFRETAALAAEQVEAAEAANVPIRVILLGDVAYAAGSRDYKECLAEFDDTWGTFKRYFLPVPGNHDYHDDPPDAASYFQYFAEFYEGLKNKSNNRSYLYVFPENHPNAWSLFALNFYRGRAAEFEYAETMLKPPDQGCKMAFTHPFFLSSGSHGRPQEFRDEMLEPFMEVLVSTDTSLLLSAHDHDFELFKKVDAQGDIAELGGVRLFVVGTGGAPLYRASDNARHPASDLIEDAIHGVLKIELFEDYYRWAFLPIEGTDAEDAWKGEDFCNRP